MKKDIIDIVQLVRSAEWLGGEDHIEIAKGRNQIDNSWSGFKRKLRRSVNDNYKNN